MIMQCGHSANGTTSSGDPACVICVGFDEGATKVALNQPNLEGRTAKCSSCKTTTQSKATLAFFSHRPSYETDGYYCGCRGWE
jgi:hypothetical protein